MAKILITGATGTIGTQLTKHLKQDHQLTLVDIDFDDFPEELKEDSDTIQLDLIKRENWENLLDGIEYVIHLAGVPDMDADFYGELEELNYEIPHNLYDEALEAKELKRIIFASSIHTVDAYPDNVQVKISDPVRPNNLYGLSKVYLEGLATYHAYKNRLPSIGIRIADYKADNSELKKDADQFGMSMFFSARDMNHLIDCCLAANLEEPYLLVNGVSNNTFPRLSLAEAREKLGYEPKDDAFKMNGYFE